LQLISEDECQKIHGGVIFCLTYQSVNPGIFDDQLNTLIYFHPEKHKSGRQLIQFLDEDDFARNNITPKGIEKSSDG
jgi:hypothetical protein